MFLRLVFLCIALPVLSTQHMIISRMRGKYNVIENRR